LTAGVMEQGEWRAMVTGTPQGGVISPLLSNIYLHVLDRVWEDRCARLGTLVRSADDFVVMCDTQAAVEEARQRVSAVLTRRSWRISIRCSAGGRSTFARVTRRTNSSRSTGTSRNACMACC